MHLTLTINIEILHTNPPPHFALPPPYIIHGTTTDFCDLKKKLFKEMEFSISSKHTLRRIFNSNLFPDEIIFFH